MDKAKEWQMELLMEKLRSKAGQYKPFSESAKMLRMALLVCLCVIYKKSSHKLDGCHLKTNNINISFLTITGEEVSSRRG